MNTNFVPEVFGRLTTLDAGYMVYGGQRNRKYHMTRCICGNEKQVLRQHLLAGSTQSCGCLLTEEKMKATTKHGHSPKGRRTPEYMAYQGMKDRCYNPNCETYKNYGARGIGIWNYWLGEDGFLCWLSHLGNRPSKDHSLDRIGVDGHYIPGNVRWATAIEQANNKRNSVWLMLAGKKQTITQWFLETGIPQHTIRYRLKAGWSIEDTLTKTVRRKLTHGDKDDDPLPTG